MADGNWQNVIDWLEANTKPDGHFLIEWNEHRVYHATVADELDEQPSPAPDFENAEERARAIELNTMVCLRWYYATSVGFMHLGAPDLQSLLAWLTRLIEPGGIRG